ncbi:MAG: autotransporter outer membrane beta-barrel domain-containing protein [Rhodospirillaceae bacterium]
MIVRCAFIVLPILSLGSVLLAGTSHTAQAACTRNGIDVTCTDSDPDGFLAPSSQIRLTVNPGATVHNLDNGEFAGDCDELALPSIWIGDDSAVTNGGVVTPSGVCGFAIALGDRGTVINRGQITTYGALGIGVLAGDNLTATNAGTIVTNDRAAYGFYSGSSSVITMEAGSSLITAGAGASGIMAQDFARITNKGRIQALDEAADGINAGANATIVNAGEITVLGAQAAAIRVLGGTVAITNSGQARALFAGQTNAPAHAIAVDAAGTSVTLTNSGVIAGAFAGARLNATTSLALTNTGSITAAGEHRNDGTVVGGGAAVMVTAPVGIGVGISNFGQITGVGGIAALRASGGNIGFTNSGTITGDVIFSGGDDTLTMVTGGQMSGTLDGGDGFDTLLLAGAGTGTFAPAMTNIEVLSKSGGGAWTLNSALTFSKQASILDGTLRIASGVTVTTPTLYVNTSGILAGDGAIAGTVSNTGTVAPGINGGPATLTILGAYAQDGAGTLALHVNSDGTSDKLMIGGTATLGGTLKLTYDTAIKARRFTGTRTYRIIAAANPGLTIQGDFTSVITNAPFIDSQIAKAANGVDLIVNRLSYGTRAVSRSQRAIGETLDRLSAAPPAALNGVINALESGTPATATGILAALAPETAPALQNLGLFTLQSLREIAPPGASDQTFSVWGQYLNRHGSTARTDTAAFRYDLGGAAAGVDVGAGEKLRIGAMVAHSDGRADFTAPAQANLDGNFAGAHLTYGWDMVTATAGVIYGTAHPDQRRTQTLLGNTTTLSSRSTADLWSLYATLAARFDLGPVMLSPSATLSRDSVSLGRLDEGAPLSTAVSASDARALRAEVSVQGALSLGVVRPYMGLHAAKELQSGRREAMALLNGVPGSEFLISGAWPRGISVTMDGGLAADLAPGLAAYAGARFTANDVFAGRTLTAGLTYRW